MGHARTLFIKTDCITACVTEPVFASQFMINAMADPTLNSCSASCMGVACPGNVVPVSLMRDNVETLQKVQSHGPCSLALREAKTASQNIAAEAVVKMVKLAKARSQILGFGGVGEAAMGTKD